MKSLQELYRTGNGPSSSHSMAPGRAASIFGEQHPEAVAFHVALYGSLAATGKGHLTDIAIREKLHPREVEFFWHLDEEINGRPNGMVFEALGGTGEVTALYTDHSMGGGALLSDSVQKETYAHESLGEIVKICEDRGESFWEYVQKSEGESIWSFLAEIWDTMQESIENGLRAEGVLPGGLGLYRKAHSLRIKSAMLGAILRKEALLAAYAYAVAEENASSGHIVTAPTCGASGVVPSVLLFMKDELSCGMNDIYRALATAGLIGNVVKTNGSIAGSTVGCQGEIGTACAMAAAAAAQLLGGSPRQIEYAAEMGLEHHLGLTCDPVAGLVQIPCIERNAHAATRALSCAHFALISDGSHRISFDDAVSVMLETGLSMSCSLKETSRGGLARVYAHRILRQNSNCSQTSGTKEL